MVYSFTTFYKRTFSSWVFFSAEFHLLVVHKLLSLFTNSTLHQIAISFVPHHHLLHFIRGDVQALPN